MKYLCSDCESEMEVFDKDDVIIVYPCKYCAKQEETLKRLNAVASARGQINFAQFKKDEQYEPPEEMKER